MKRWSGATPLPGTWRMRRGEVWWVEFEPAVGSEIRKTRPAVIVSNDAANRNLAPSKPPTRRQTSPNYSVG